MSNLVINNSQSTDVNPQLQFSEVQEIDIEEAMEKVGQRHKYQKIVIGISMLTMFIITFSFMVIPYYLSPPNFECFKDGAWSTCDEDNGACDTGVVSRLQYESTKSIASELDLYCDKRDWRTVIQSMPYFGCIIDNKGRAIAIKLSWTIGTIFAIVLNFSVNIPMLIIGSFGMGLGVQSLLVLIIVHCNELSNGQFRVVSVILLYVVWAVNEMQYVWILEIFQNWKWCTFICFTAPFTVLNIFPFVFVHDSPRFLYQKNREKCLQRLNYIAKFNKRECILNQELKETGRNEDRSYSYLDLFRYKSQRNCTIFMTILFISPHILYYGIQVSLDQLGSSFEKNSLFIGIGELIGYIVSDIICHKVVRKKGTFITLIVSCLLCISFFFFQIPEECKETGNDCWQKPLQTTMAALARCILSFTFSFMILLCGESYPMTLKSAGYGFTFGLGFSGGFLSPYIVDISNRIGINPMISLGILSLSGCVAVLFLKETLDQPMLQEIPELIERASSRKSLLIQDNYHSDIQNSIVENQQFQDEQNYEKSKQYTKLAQ